jgi:hypothetical protein
MIDFEEIADIAVMLLIIPLVWLMENEWAQYGLIIIAFLLLVSGHWVFASLFAALLLFVRYVAWENKRY